MPVKDSPAKKRGRMLYIFQAAFEYLTNLVMSGSFLAVLTRELGFSDSLTGILSSVLCLGCLFQLLSIPCRIRRVKKMVIACTVVNQLLFIVLYLLPLTEWPAQVKTVLFVAVIMTAYILYYFVFPKKTTWLMSQAADGQRGTFTASKEMFSLLVGMVFSYVMGAVSDHCFAIGAGQTGFLIFACVMFLLMLLNVSCLVFTEEEEQPESPRVSLRQIVAEMAADRGVIRMAIMLSLYYIAYYMAIPFYGTYKISELGFSLKFVSVLTILYSVVRMAVSRAWGRYADRRSFALLMERCLWIFAASLLCVVFAVPANGVVMFLGYHVLFGIAQGGLGSAQINMVFDHVPPEKRSDALAVCQAASGFAGFLSTLAVGPLVDHIQRSGNMLLGIPVYAQQVVSLLGILFTFATIAYLRLAVMKKK